MINREVGIMIRYQHPTIIKFKGFSIKDFLDEKNVTILMEHVSRGSLAEFLQKVKSGLLEVDYDNTKRQILLIGIARGMMYLHQNHIIHRDLKKHNILLDGNLCPLITDFGLSKFYGKEFTTSQSKQCGTCIYMAPEIMEGFRYSGKVDVYAFGILMYEIVTDMEPCPELKKGKLTEFQFTNKVVNDNYRPKFETPVKNSIKQFIERCWSKKSKDRPSFEELFNKLAYHIEESISDINEDREVGTTKEEGKYYLENVNVDEVLSYTNEIDEMNFAPDDGIFLKFEKLKRDNEEMFIKFDKKLRTVRDENEKLKKDNEEMKSKLTELKNEVVDLKN